MTRLLLVDDHMVVRAGIRRLLSGRPEMEVLEAETLDQAIALAGPPGPDVVLLDLNLPGLGGIEALRRFRAEAPGVPVVVFSMHAEPVYATRAMDAGALGYVSKAAPPGEILAAIDSALRNAPYLEIAIAQERDERALESNDYLHSLTGRDLEILRLLVAGHSMNEIARSLGVAYKTIANTCTKLRNKLGARSAAELISVTKNLGIA